MWRTSATRPFSSILLPTWSLSITKLGFRWVRDPECHHGIKMHPRRASDLAYFHCFIFFPSEWIHLRACLIKVERMRKKLEQECLSLGLHSNVSLWPWKKLAFIFRGHWENKGIMGDLSRVSGFQLCRQTGTPRTRIGSFKRAQLVKNSIVCLFISIVKRLTCQNLLPWPHISVQPLTYKQTSTDWKKDIISLTKLPL